jgi:hypothetical protein
MSNPFDDLDGDDVTGTEKPGSTGEEPTTAEESTTEGDSTGRAAAASADTEPAAAAELEAEPSSPGESGPAFEYSSVRQRPLYARGETWDSFERTLRTTIGPALAEADVLDEETREIHDAILRLAVSEPERVTELVLDARREAE